MLEFIISFILIYSIVNIIRRVIVRNYLNKIVEEIADLGIEEIKKNVTDEWPARFQRFNEIADRYTIGKAIRQFYLPVRSFFNKDYILNGNTTQEHEVNI